MPRRLLAALALALLLALPAHAEPDRPFVSDGCSLWPDGDWGQCCKAHDWAYWQGGTYWDRVHADAQLGECVGGPMGWLMSVGVRLGGAAILPTRFRWGFGYDWPRAGPER